MNSVEDDDFSHWDSLADELGLEHKPAPPKPPASVKPTPIPEPLPAVEVKRRIVEPDVEPEAEAEPIPQVHEESLEPLSEDGDIPETADTVLDDEDLVDSGSAEAETAEERDGKEEGKGRRRRRRRRKKKGGGETTAATSPAETEVAGVLPVPTAKPVVVTNIAESAIEESGVELLDDAPEELLDEGDDKTELTTAMDEELTEETAQPTQEWKVVSWNELVGSLYRPER